MPLLPGGALGDRAPERNHAHRPQAGQIHGRWQDHGVGVVERLAALLGEENTNRPRMEDRRLAQEVRSQLTRSVPCDDHVRPESRERHQSLAR